MKFGPDINAFTSFDETVYTLSIPTDKEQDVEKAFDVLPSRPARRPSRRKILTKTAGSSSRNRACAARPRRGAWKRRSSPCCLATGGAAKRLPIGDMDVVRNTSVDLLRSFYPKWYRPDLMAVIAVGDFDVDNVEKLIRERFSQLPKPGRDGPRPAGLRRACRRAAAASSSRTRRIRIPWFGFPVAAGPNARDGGGLPQPAARPPGDRNAERAVRRGGTPGEHAVPAGRRRRRHPRTSRRLLQPRQGGAGRRDTAGPGSADDRNSSKSGDMASRQGEFDRAKQGLFPRLREREQGRARRGTAAAMPTSTCGCS